MELRAGEMLRPADKDRLEPFLETFIVLPMDEAIADMAIKIRGSSLLTPPKIKLPDAIIAATAEIWQIPIVTRNPRDFHALTVAIHIPYQIDASTGQLFAVQPPYHPAP